MEAGVDRIVDQIVNPDAMEKEVESVIYRLVDSHSLYRVIFLTGPPLKMSLDWPPPNLLGLAPP